MVSALKTEAAVRAVVELADMVDTLSKGDASSAVLHFRAARAFAGSAIGKDLLSEKERRAGAALMVIDYLRTMPCSDEVRRDLDELAVRGGVLLDEDVIERAETLWPYLIDRGY